jgi:hypothetical protein
MLPTAISLPRFEILSQSLLVRYFPMLNSELSESKVTYEPFIFSHRNFYTAELRQLCEIHCHLAKRG